MAAREPNEPGGSTRKTELRTLAAGLFARDGYASTTVRDIADAAGILSGSLYHHFPAKESIAAAVLAGLLDPLLARCEQVAAGELPAPEAFEGLVAVAFDAIGADRAASVVYADDGRRLLALPGLARLAAADRRMERIWLDVLERGVAEGDFRAGLDPQVAVRLVRETLWSVARWYDPADGPRLAEIREQCLRILLDGVVKAKKKRKR